VFFALEEPSNLFHWSTLVFLLAESSAEATEAAEATKSSTAATRVNESCQNWWANKYASVS
jgi:hypothetical protein